MEDRLMIAYFELICSLHPGRVLEELKKGDFP